MFALPHQTLILSELFPSCLAPCSTSLNSSVWIDNCIKLTFSECYFYLKSSIFVPYALISLYDLKSYNYTSMCNEKSSHVISFLYSSFL